MKQLSSVHDWGDLVGVNSYMHPLLTSCVHFLVGPHLEVVQLLLLCCVVVSFFSWELAASGFSDESTSIPNVFHHWRASVLFAVLIISFMNLPPIMSLY